MKFKILALMHVEVIVPRTFLGAPAPDASTSWNTKAVVPASYDTLEKKLLLAAQVALAAYEKAYQNFSSQSLLDNSKDLKEFECSIDVNCEFELLPESKARNFDGPWCGIELPGSKACDFDGPWCGIELHVNHCPDDLNRFEDIGVFNTLKDFMDYVTQEVIEKMKNDQIETDKKGVIGTNRVFIRTYFADIRSNTSTGEDEELPFN